MARIGSFLDRSADGRFLPALDPAPADFRETFLRLGRVLCEEHYGRGRVTINRWIEHSGGRALIEARAVIATEQSAAAHRRSCPPDFDVAFVHLGPCRCQRRYHAGNKTMQRWIDERGRERLLKARDEYLNPSKRMDRRDVGRLLSIAYPVASTLPSGK